MRRLLQLAFLVACLWKLPASFSVPRLSVQHLSAPRGSCDRRAAVGRGVPCSDSVTWQRLRSARASATGATGETAGLKRYAVWFYILLWYVFSIQYNITFKKALIAFPYPWTCAMWQMAFGMFIFGPLWAIGLRKRPRLTREEALRIWPSAFGNLVLHVGAVIAFFGGAVSFVHIVKASEPVVSSLLNYVFVGEVLAWPVYAALLPIIGGVALASCSELTFTWLGFSAAMLSNLGSAGRAVYAKKVMSGKNIGENMDAANTFSVMTLMGTVMLLPLWLWFEPLKGVLPALQTALATKGNGFLANMLGSGMYYYLYNELAFLALGKLDPVSHAVVNTMKRVAIIVVAIVVFQTKVTKLGAAGSSVAVLGTLLYSLAKARCKK